MKKPVRSKPYICGECAKKMGGVWPPKHVATCHYDICPYCRKMKSLASIGDYNWKSSSFLDMRD